MTRPSAVRAALAALCVLSLAACAPTAMRAVSSIDQVDSSHLVVVGRIELVPALTPREYELQSFTLDDYENVALILTGEEYRQLRSRPELADYESRIEAPLGQFFYAEAAAGPLYVLGAEVMVFSGNPLQPDRIYLPGGLKATFDADDRAVYIGTLRFHRNEFFEITGVELIDEYEAAGEAFGRRFSTDLRLRRSLLEPVSR